MNAEQIIQIMEKAKELGFHSVKISPAGDLEFGSAQTKQINPPQNLPDDIIKKLSTIEDMTDDEILYWSTDYYNELEALRLGKNKIEE